MADRLFARILLLLVGGAVLTLGVWLVTSYADPARRVDGAFARSHGGDARSRAPKYRVAGIKLGDRIPTDYSYDLLAYPGAVGEERDGPRTSFRTLDKLAAVFTYYRKKLAAAGWAFDLGGDGGLRKTIDFSGEGYEGTITITASGDGASVLIEIRR